MKQRGLTPILVIIGVLIVSLLGYIILIGFPENKKCGQVFTCHGIPLSNQCLGYKSTFVFIDCAKTNSQPIVQPAPVQATETPLPTTKLEFTSSAGTANWKTYTNNKYGIQFSYPFNLKPGKYTSDNGVSLIADFSDDQNNDLQVWVALSGGAGHGGDFSMKQVSNDTKVRVANHDATLIIWETDISSSLYSIKDPILRRYSVVLDNKPVIIELTGETANTSIDQLNQILFTFKFTQ